VTVQLITIVGLTLAGGILLLWVCWKMFRELRHSGHEERDAQAIIHATSGAPAKPMSFRAAVIQIILADLSMSLDNVLAVAGAAKGSPAILIIGLAVAVVLMAVASNAIANLLARYPWITWIGLLIILYVALDMVWDGWRQVERAYPSLWSALDIWRGVNY
jgi:YjbE family integral membrane protein